MPKFIGIILLAGAILLISIIGKTARPAIRQPANRAKQPRREQIFNIRLQATEPRYLIL